MQAAALAERESVPLLYLSGAQWCCKKFGLVNIPPAVPAKAYSGCTETYRETVMSKGMEQKKETKKKPAKTQLEKRVEKKEKKEQRDKK